MKKNILQELKEEAEFPYNYGKPNEIEGFVELNPSCGDQVKIYPLISDTSVKIYFESEGCTLSKAMASLLARYVEIHDLEYLKKLTEAEILAEILDLKLGPNRSKCALLPILALKRAIKC